MRLACASWSVNGPVKAKSLWLNLIEAICVHGMRAVSEVDRLVRADELEARVYTYHGGECEAH